MSRRLFSLFADKSSMIMVCIQVIGNDTTIAIAGSQGNFELNPMRPSITKCSSLISHFG